MSNEELVSKIQAGEREAAAGLWDNVKRLVFYQARRYMVLHAESCKAAGLELDDLGQWGYFAMLAAVKDYQPIKGYTFNTYLTYHLKNAFNTAAGLRTARQRRDPLRYAASLDAPAGETEGDGTLNDIVPDPQGEAGFTSVTDQEYNRELRAVLDRCIDTLKPTEQAAIREYYFTGQTDRETGERWGTESRYVANQRRAALSKLRRRQTVAELTKWQNEVIPCYSWRSVSYHSFMETWTSATERTALKLLELQGNKQKE